MENKDLKIEVKDLTVNYGDFKALNSITLNINKGMFGLLGRNGAGKTTFMKVLVTLIKKSSGDIKILGEDIRNVKFIRENIGYLPQDFNIYPNMKVYEIMDYLGTLSSLKNPKRKDKINELLKLVNLEKDVNKKFKGLSGGMKRRLGIACALLSDPKIVIVDEPTAGLDPEERIRFRNLLSTISDNKIVILSTHIIEDIEHSCNNIGILKEGNLIYSGDIKTLKANIEGLIYETTIKSNDFNKFNTRYLVISRMEEKNGLIRVRFIHKAIPENSFNKVDESFEDAYIALLNGMVKINKEGVR